MQRIEELRSACSTELCDAIDEILSGGIHPSALNDANAELTRVINDDLTHLERLVHSLEQIPIDTALEGQLRVQTRRHRSRLLELKAILTDDGRGTNVSVGEAKEKYSGQGED